MTNNIENKSRIEEAYRAMAGEGRHRPNAPSDLVPGYCVLTDEELADPKILEHEAAEYADRFMEEQRKCMFLIGRTSFNTVRASVYAIEAARLISGRLDDHALGLLRMAEKELRSAMRAKAKALHRRTA